MSLISPNFDVKLIIFSQFWPGAFSQNCWKRPCTVIYISVIFGMFADETFSYVQKDDMDRKIVAIEDQIPHALSDLFLEVSKTWSFTSEHNVFTVTD